MFCARCRTQVPDNTVFCPNCGNRLIMTPGAAPRNPGYANNSAMPRNTGNVNRAAIPGNPSYVNRGAAMPRNPGYANNGIAAPGYGGYMVPAGHYPQAQAAPEKVKKSKKKKKKKSRVPLAICSTLLIVAIVAATVVFGIPIGKPYLKPIDNLFTGFNNQDAAQMLDSVVPELNTFISVEDLFGDFDPGVRISYQVLSDNRVKANDPVFAILKVFGVKRCYKVNTYVTVSYYEEPVESDELAFYVAKLKGKWRIVYVEGLLQMG